MAKGLRRRAPTPLSIRTRVSPAWSIHPLPRRVKRAGAIVIKTIEIARRVEPKSLPGLDPFLSGPTDPLRVRGSDDFSLHGGHSLTAGDRSGPRGTRSTGTQLASIGSPQTSSPATVCDDGRVPEEMITEADREVFAHYGRTMLAVQAFEFTLYQLVQLQHEGFPEEGEFDEVWREHIEPLFKLTPGELQSRLRGADDALVEELGAAVDTRNLLVHRFLFNYRLSAV